MAKLTLNTIGSRYGSIEALNDNFDAIEQALENTFSLDGTSPNALEADLDMNSNDILNAGNISTGSLIINGVQVEPGVLVTAGSVFQTYEFTATEGQTTFSVAPAIPLATSIIVIVNGLQLPPSELSVSGTNVVTPAMKAGDEVIIRRFTAESVAPAIFPDATDVNFIQAGTGAVVRTSQNKMRDIVSVKDFGAVGNGIVDETAAFQLAVNAVQALGGGTVFIPAGRYKIKSQILITGDNVTIKGEGNSSVLDCSELCYYTQFGSLDIDFNSPTYYRRAAFAVRGTFVKEVYLDTAAMPVLENQSTLTLVAGGTSNIQIGDSVFLRSKQHWYGGGERFAISKVIDINAGTNVVTLMDGVPQQMDSTGLVRTFNVAYSASKTYSINAEVIYNDRCWRSLAGSNIGNTPTTSPTWWLDIGSAVPYAEWGGYYTWMPEVTNTRLVVWRPVKNFELSNLSAEGGGLSFTAVGFGPGLDGVSTQTILPNTVIKNGGGQCLLHAHYAENVNFNNVSITKGFRGVVILTTYSSDIGVSNSYFRGLPDDSFVPTENINSGWYALGLNAGRSFRVINCIFDRTRHGPDGSECFNYVQSGNVAYRTFKAAYGSHQEVYDLTITGNTAYDCYSFASLRAKDATVVGNSSYSSVSNSQPEWGAGGMGTTIQTQETDDPGVFVISNNSFVTNASIPGGILTIDAAIRSCTISGNSISVREGGGIYIASSNIENFIVDNNTITFTNVDEAPYPGGTPYIFPSIGITIKPRLSPFDYAAYFGPHILTTNINSMKVSGNTITGYGGTTSYPSSGNGILIFGSPSSSGTFNNVLIDNNVGRARTNNSGHFIRTGNNSYIGSNFTVSNNTCYGNPTLEAFGYAPTDEYVFYQAPLLINNTSQSNVSKTNLPVGNYTSLGDGTTLIKGAVLNNPQPDIGEAFQYVVTDSGTTGSLAAGITASTTSGSPTVTLIGNSFGDTYVVPGSYISIAGANTGVRVIAVSSDYLTITLESNATATVAGAAVTRYNPTFGTVSTVVPFGSSSGGIPTLTVVTGTSATALSGNHYVLTNVATTTVTLPASPVVGDLIWITVGNGLTTNVVNRNGNNIQSIAENLTLNAAYASVQLRYIDSTIGWTFT